MVLLALARQGAVMGGGGHTASCLKPRLSREAGAGLPQVGLQTVAAGLKG